MLIKFHLPREDASLLPHRLGATFAQAMTTYGLVKGFNVTDDGLLYDRALNLYEPTTGKKWTPEPMEQPECRYVSLQDNCTPDRSYELPRHQKFSINPEEPLEIVLRGTWRIGESLRKLSGRYGLLWHHLGHHLQVWKNPRGEFARPADGDEFFMLPRSKCYSLRHWPEPTEMTSNPALRWAPAGQLTMLTLADPYQLPDFDTFNPNVLG